MSTVPGPSGGGEGAAEPAGSPPRGTADGVTPPAHREPADPDSVQVQEYRGEQQLPGIMALISGELSEPYSIYTYRYFIHNWPNLTFVAMQRGRCVGTVVCKLAKHKSGPYRGYIAMLAVDRKCRKKRVGTRLVQRALHAMVAAKADEVVLETEVTNTHAIRLYEKLGFARDKMLYRYYLNGVDAIRLKLWLR
mmetsp:Transcript_16843/g.43793  ORF Transcript_16843/g.43793 Transcript_16843/m.43793 type:complete len:193 (+) Transcript_16843:169-747(+)